MWRGFSEHNRLKLQWLCSSGGERRGNGCESARSSTSLLRVEAGVSGTDLASRLLRHRALLLELPGENPKEAVAVHRVEVVRHV